MHKYAALCIRKNNLTGGLSVMLPFPHIIRMFYNHQKWQLPVTQGKLTQQMVSPIYVTGFVKGVLYTQL